jgi:tetratricopeptide (TPR) repeat protein
VEQGESRALLSLAFMLAEKGEETGAEAAFAEARRLNVPEAANSVGYWLISIGRATEAEAIYREALAAGDFSVYRNLGNVLADTPGGAEEAMRCYRAAIASGDAAALTTAGLLLIELGDADRARPLLEQAAADGDDDARGALRELA